LMWEFLDGFMHISVSITSRLHHRI
jgi:hypothetical protein